LILVGERVMSHTTAFDMHTVEYDDWFEKHAPAYVAELSAMRRFVPAAGSGLEVGVGTGRFAQPLGIAVGVDLALGMLELARQRGVSVCQTAGEQLSFRNGQFDYVVLVTVVCFVEDVARLLDEAQRVVKPGGKVIVGFIDRCSALGQMYESRKESNVFYRDAHFYTTLDIAGAMRTVGLDELHFCQTLLGMPGESPAEYAVLDGYGDGAFVVISATKMA